MRLTYHQHTSLADTDTHGITVNGAQDERFTMTVLEHDIVRVQHWPDGAPRLNRTWLVVDDSGDTPREGRPRDDLSPFSLPKFDLTTDGDTLRVKTEAIGEIEIDTAQFRLKWSTAGGDVFLEDVPMRGYAYDRGGRAVFHTVQWNDNDHFYGFGEVTGPLNKARRRIEMRNMDVLNYNAETTTPIYKHFPFYITYNPQLNLAYGLFYDNLASTVFDMGNELDAIWGQFRYYRAEDGDIDYYLLYGPTIAEVVEKFTRLTGRPHMPPKWSLGYLGSTMKYTESENAQEELKEFVDQCKQYDIPCDMFHLSSGYTTDEKGRRCVFTWNHDRVPQPEKMVGYFHSAHMRVAANIKPYLLRAHPNYNNVAEAGGFVKNAEANEPEAAMFWSGGAYESELGAFIDFTSEAGYTWWQRKVKEQLFTYGIDVTWNDNNEFEIWDDEARLDGFGEGLRAGLARPLLTLLMNRASYEITRDTYPDRRPFQLSRSGCPGVSRYAQMWSGDNHTDWHTLRYNIPMGLGMSLSGAPNIGHDVGGFGGPKPDPELFLRWVQNGVFHPRFTIHSWNTDATVNEPWMFPEMTAYIRDAIRLRYRLLPYFYSLFYDAHRIGQPIIRPLVYHFPDDPNCHDASFDFLLGPYLLVASVTEPGARRRQVYLPAGTRWCDYHTGRWYEGGQTINVEAPLDRIPLFVRAGGMLPFGRAQRYVGEMPDNVRVIYAYPDPDDEGHPETFTLYEDDGESNRYHDGAYELVELSVEVVDGEVIPAAQALRGGYDLLYDDVTFVLPQTETRPMRAIGGKKDKSAGGRQALTVPLL